VNILCKSITHCGCLFSNDFVAWHLSAYVHQLYSLFWYYTNLRCRLLWKKAVKLYWHISNLQHIVFLQFFRVIASFELGRPTYDESLRFFAVHFWIPGLYKLPDGQAAPRQKYIRCLVLGWIDEIDEDVSPICSHFIGVRKSEIWPRYSLLVTIERSSFESKQRMQNLKT